MAWTPPPPPPKKTTKNKPEFYWQLYLCGAVLCLSRVFCGCDLTRYDFCVGCTPELHTGSAMQAFCSSLVCTLTKTFSLLLSDLITQGNKGIQKTSFFSPPIHLIGCISQLKGNVFSKAALNLPALFFSISYWLEAFNLGNRGSEKDSICLPALTHIYIPVTLGLQSGSHLKPCIHLHPFFLKFRLAKLLWFGFSSLCCT